MYGILNVVFCFLLCLAFNKSYSQTVIDYSAWSTSQCNAFYPFPPTINGIVHTTTCGTVIYDNTNHAIELDTRAENNIYKGTEYKLGYNFKQGYSYTIKINAWCSKPTFPEPSSKLRADFTSASNGGGLFCNGVELFNTTSSLTNDNNQPLSSGTYFDYTFQYNSLPVSQSFLYVGGFLLYINGTATSWILIKKITITETPPPVSFTLPASTSFVCGTTTPQTFTVTNVYGTTGITNYAWNLGSASNGWLYNGSPAPQTISTGTTGSITLTPVCGAVQSNVSATVTANGNTYITNINAVSTTPPVMSINGSHTICYGSSVYQIDGLPCNSTVTWSVTPAGVVTVDNSNPPQVTLTGIANGNVTLEAAISSACGNPTLTLPIHVGAPNPITGISYDYSMVHCMVVGYKITLAGGEYATSYKWYTRNISQGEQNFTLFRNTADNHLTMGGDGSCDQIEVKVEAYNDCNPNDPQVYTFISDLCPPFPDGSCTYPPLLKISPNPASSLMTVQLSDTAQTHPEIRKILKIRITDRSGQMKKEFTGNSTGHLTIDLSSLPAGVYTLSVFDGVRWISKQIVKN